MPVKEKLIHVEVLSDTTLGIKFGEKVFDQDLVKLIKATQESKFDIANKEWIVSRSQIHKIYFDIAPICIAKGIKIVEIPDFVYTIAKNPVPYSAAPPHTVFGPRAKLLKDYTQENNLL